MLLLSQTLQTELHCNPVKQFTQLGRIPFSPELNALKLQKEADQLRDKRILLQFAA